jgi:Rps23 Pro-64 3,4-dihydroxylase Tpa1-like proline 4-hydroxylase
MNESASRLNPGLDREGLAETFQSNGRVRIADVLAPEFAEQVYQSIDGDIPWSLMYFDHEASGPDVIGRLTPRRRARMSEAEFQALVERVHADAATRYQSWYKGYDILAARREGRDPGLFLQRFLDFIGSDELFDLVRQVSGDQLFNRVDCHACRYDPGHFLKEHADKSPFEDRRMAYVFNFSRAWDADFGGLTHFLDDDHQVTDTFIPRFNSLVLFRVPVNHSVSMVANFAPRPRYSITGWFTHYA